MTEQRKYLLTREEIEKAIVGPPVIRHDEPWGHMLAVVVAAGVGRYCTVVTHLLVAGEGNRTHANRRRVEEVGVPVYSDSENWESLVRQLVDYAAGLPNVTITIDTAAMGLQFLKRVQELAPALSVRGVQFGGEIRQAKRFHTRRAQAYVETAEAIQDGAVRLCSAMGDTMIRQAREIPYWFDESGLYHIPRYMELCTRPAGAPDLWDTVAMAFLDGVSFTPVPGTRSVGRERVQVPPKAHS